MEDLGTREQGVKGNHGLGERRRRVGPGYSVGQVFKVGQGYRVGPE